MIGKIADGAHLLPYGEFKKIFDTNQGKRILCISLFTIQTLMIGKDMKKHSA